MHIYKLTIIMAVTIQSMDNYIMYKKLKLNVFLLPEKTRHVGPHAGLSGTII